MFIRRISSQVHQAKSLIQSLLGIEPQQSSQRADLVRDKFGLHKMIVAVTSSGKVKKNNFKFFAFKSIFLFLCFFTKFILKNFLK